MNLLGALAASLVLQLEREIEKSKLQRDKETSINKRKKVETNVPNNSEINDKIFILDDVNLNTIKEEITKSYNDLRVPSLCLLSPWINIPSLNPSYSKNEKYDILNSRFISDSKKQYLGRNLNELSIYHSKEVLGLKIIDIFKVNNIKVVVFDLDQCIVNMHSRGLLKRKNVDLFINKIKIDFIIFSKLLFESGIKLAIGTHSDDVEYNVLKTEKNYIIGKELVEVLLSKTVPDLKNHFKIIAYNPVQHNNKLSLNSYKKLHVRETSEFYNISTTECVLFDDDQGNIDNTDNLFNAYKVNVHEGFELNSYLINQIIQKGFVAAKIYESNNKTIDTKNSTIAEYLDTQISGFTDDQISRCTDAVILKSRNFWKGKGVNNIERIFPYLMTDKQLSLFPATLIFGGGNERFIDDIQDFGDRLLHNQKNNDNNFENIDTGDYDDYTYDNNEHGKNRKIKDIKSSDYNKKQKSELIVAINDIHVYPMYWRHPLHRVLTPLGLEWLFYVIFPYRKKCNDDYYNDDDNNDNDNNDDKDIHYNTKSEECNDENDETLYTELNATQKLVHSKSANDAIVKIAKFIIGNSKKLK
jgi:hypothetical protein